MVFFFRMGKFWLDEMLHFGTPSATLTMEAGRSCHRAVAALGDLAEAIEEEFARVMHSTLLRMGLTGKRE